MIFTTISVFSNKLLNITISDKNGLFEIIGSAYSLAKIDLFIRIIHKCNRDPHLVKVNLFWHKKTV